MFSATDAPPGSLGPIEADRHTDSTNIITGLTMGTLFMALVIIFIVFYVHQKKNSERYKQQVHTSMMGAVVTGSSMKESTSPCSSVSLSDGCESASRSDSNTSPSRDTMAQSSKGTEVTGLKSMSQSSSTSGRVDTSGQELTCITRKGSSGNSEDDVSSTGHSTSYAGGMRCCMWTCNVLSLNVFLQILSPFMNTIVIFM